MEKYRQHDRYIQGHEGVVQRQSDGVISPISGRWVTVRKSTGGLDEQAASVFGWMVFTQNFIGLPFIGYLALFSIWIETLNLPLMILGKRLTDSILRGLFPLKVILMIMLLRNAFSSI